jgi:hypothetical protein
MVGCYGTSAKDIRALMDLFNDDDDLHIDGRSLGGFSTKSNKEVWAEINTVADEESDDEDDEEGDEEGS